MWFHKIRQNTTMYVVKVYDHVVAVPYTLHTLYRMTPREFNSYGARRGNDSVMARGTFANIRLVNKFMSKPGPKTLHFPSGETPPPSICTKNDRVSLQLHKAIL